MAAIEQFYFTHCTYGTARFDRRAYAEDEVKGYTIRAASFDNPELGEQMGAAVQPVAYELPPDTPDQVRRHLPADRAPKRLVFQPHRQGRCILGQVCYRATDSSPGQRVGSYFGHFAFADAPGGRPPLTSLEALQLWNARGWRIEDASDIDPCLEPLESFGCLADQNRPSPVNDDVLRGFLFVPAGEDFYDPGGIIPPLCRNAAPEVRQMLLQRLIRGFLELRRDQGEPMLVAAPPGLAALLFYGVLRLIPATLNLHDVSFSTYETDWMNLRTTLGATMFFDSRTSELPPAVLSSVGFALNLFRGAKTSEFRHGHEKYPHFIVRRLVDEGWQDVDRMLSRFNTYGPTDGAALEELVELHTTVCSFFPPQAEPVAITNSRQRQYTTLQLEHRVLESETGADEMAAVAQSRNAIPLANLLFEQRPRAARRADLLDAFVEHLPIPKIDTALKSPHLPREIQERLVKRFVADRGSLPGTARHWLAALEDPAAKGTPPHARSVAESWIKEASSAESVVDVYRHFDEQQRKFFLKFLLRVCDRYREQLNTAGAETESAIGDNLRVLQDALQQVTEAWSPDEVFLGLQQLGKPLADNVPGLPHKPDTRVRRQLDRFFKDLPKQQEADDLAESLKRFYRVASYLPSRAQNWGRLWCEFCQQLDELQTAVQRSPKLFRDGEGNLQALDPVVKSFRHCLRFEANRSGANPDNLLHGKMLLAVIARATAPRIAGALVYRMVFPEAKALIKQTRSRFVLQPGSSQIPKLQFTHPPYLSSHVSVSVEVVVYKGQKEVGKQTTRIPRNEQGKGSCVVKFEDLGVKTVHPVDTARSDLDVVKIRYRFESPYWDEEIPTPRFPLSNQQLDMKKTCVLELQDGRSFLQGDIKFLRGVLHD